MVIAKHTTWFNQDCTFWQCPDRIEQKRLQSELERTKEERDSYVEQLKQLVLLLDPEDGKAVYDVNDEIKKLAKENIELRIKLKSEEKKVITLDKELELAIKELENMRTEKQDRDKKDRMQVDEMSDAQVKSKELITQKDNLEIEVRKLNLQKEKILADIELARNDVKKTLEVIEQRKQLEADVKILRLEKEHYTSFISKNTKPVMKLIAKSTKYVEKQRYDKAMKIFNKLVPKHSALSNVEKGMVEKEYLDLYAKLRFMIQKE